MSDSTIRPLVTISATGARTETTVSEDGLTVTITRISASGAVTVREESVLDGEAYRARMMSAAEIQARASLTLEAAEREGRAIARKTARLATGGKQARAHLAHDLLARMTRPA